MSFYVCYRTSRCLRRCIQATLKLPINILKRTDLPWLNECPCDNRKEIHSATTTDWFGCKRRLVKGVKKRYAYRELVQLPLGWWAWWARVSLGMGIYRDVIVACNRITEVAFRSYFSRLPKIICFPLFSSFPAWVRPDTARERESSLWIHLETTKRTHSPLYKKSLEFLLDSMDLV